MIGRCSLYLLYTYVVVGGWFLSVSTQQTASVQNSLPFQYHLRENSVCNCSRAVSRWVREALDLSHITDDLRKIKNAVSLSSTSQLGERDEIEVNKGVQPCAFDIGNSLYHAQETMKHSKYGGSHWTCKLCGASFRSEFAIDTHMDTSHLPCSLKNSTLLEDDKFDSGIPSFEIGHLFCLEELCGIFDVCDRPPQRRRQSISDNPLSIAKSATVAKSTVVKTTTSTIRNAESERNEDNTLHESGQKAFAKFCDPSLLRQAKELCEKTVNACFRLESEMESIRKTNIRLKRNICDALRSCSSYLARRRHAGSHKFFIDASFIDSGESNFWHLLEGWNLGLMVFGVAFSCLIVAAIICCAVEILSDDGDDFRRPTGQPKYRWRGEAETGGPARGTQAQFRKDIPDGYKTFREVAERGARLRKRLEN